MVVAAKGPWPSAEVSFFMKAILVMIKGGYVVLSMGVMMAV